MRPKPITVPGAFTFAGRSIVPDERALRRQSSPVAVDEKAFEASLGWFDILTAADLKSVFG